jgi:hypothetical protein
VLINWQDLDKNGENKELIRNLVYSSIILFFNLIYLRQANHDTDSTVDNEGIKSLTDLLMTKVIPFYSNDQLISSAVLEYIHFLTKDPEISSIIICNEVVIDFCFSKLKEPLVQIIKFRNDEDEAESRSP